jgi:hypothetical protein
MKYLYVTLESYNKYINEFGTNRLDKWIKILPPPSKSFILNNYNDFILEAFEGIETEYELSEVESGYLIIFKCKSGYEYRFDIIKEPNTKIYDLAFSDSSNNMDDVSYENLTDRNESKELLSRLVWILKDVDVKLDVDEWCIGATNLESKNNIYQYLMKFTSYWEKRTTSKYPPSNWALYFTL